MGERTIYPLRVKDSSVDPRMLGMLEYHIAGQQADKEKGNFIPPAFESRKKILSWYQDSNHFKKVYSEAIEFYSSHRTNAGIGGFNGRLAGEMFQHIAYSYISSRLDEGNIVLSPNRTLDVINAALSEVDLQETQYDTKSLEKVKIPDGLIVNLESKEVTKICEYTVKRERGKINKHMRTVGSLGKHDPELFGESGALFVLPGPDTEMLNRLDASVIFMPIDRYQFGDFVNKVLYHYRGIPSLETDDYPATEMNATLYEVQRRIREQKKLGLQYAEYDKEKMPFDEFVRLLESEKNLSELFD